MKVLYFFF